jgi:malonyl-CoA/methylmalonyl-CoA synthetase
VGFAFVLARPGSALQADHLLQSLKGRLANFKLPKYCQLVPELPRNAMGKVQKNVLREIGVRYQLNASPTIR